MKKHQNPPQVCNFANQAIIRVCIDRNSRAKRGEYQCLIGEDIEIYSDVLATYCIRDISILAYDLSLLVGAVRFADHKVSRKRATGWARSIHIILPVHDPSKWNESEVISSLQGTLTFLTGDSWTFRFLQRVKKRNDVQATLALQHDREYVVLPASNGLDTFAQKQELIKKNIQPLLITTGRPGKPIDNQIKDKIVVPFNLKIRLYEHSDRTRSFAFGIFAALAASYVDGNKIIVPENGQGSIGPSLIPFGNEHPYRGSHPGFTKRLSHFIKVLLEKNISFDHPYLWETKGSIFKNLKENNLHAGWERTDSCSRKRHSLFSRVKHCGICGGCLLRRFTLFTAGILNAEEKYLWPDLKCHSFDKSLDITGRKTPKENDRDIAWHNVYSLAVLAKLSKRPQNAFLFQKAVFDMTFLDNTPPDEELRNLNKLLRTHKKEWDVWLEHLGSSSWVSSFAEVPNDE